ncbi:hypothetical protein HYS49_01525 [Candidatus Woesearchaeota archaeon]|nr:hypothetical protein [Candidatus Woesearchaeota archaeon]
MSPHNTTLMPVPLQNIRTLEQLLRQAGEAPSIKETISYFQQAVAVRERIPELIASQVPLLKAFKALGKDLIAHKLAGEIRDTSVPRRTLDVLMHVKLNEYRRDCPELDTLVPYQNDEEQAAFKEQCARAFYGKPLEDCFRQLQKSGFKSGLLSEYEEAKLPLKQETSFNGEEEQHYDQAFYLPLLQSFLHAVEHGTLGNKDRKAIPTTLEEVKDLTRLADELQYRFLKSYGRPALFPRRNSLGKAEEITADEYIPLLLLRCLEKRKDKSISAEQLTPYKQQLLPTIQERLYWRASEAAKQGNQKLFSLWSTAFLRWSSEHALQRGDETLEEEMNELRKTYCSELATGKETGSKELPQYTGK